MIKNKPKPHILIYSVVCTTASGGACIALATVPASGAIIIVDKTAMIAQMQIPVPILFLPFSVFFSPTASPTITVSPIAKADITPVNVVVNMLPDATPDCSATSANFPTTNKSTAPYRACRKSAPKTGKANPISAFKMLPSVKLFCFIIIITHNKKDGQDTENFTRHLIQPKFQELSALR